MQTSCTGVKRPAMSERSESDGGGANCTRVSIYTSSCSKMSLRHGIGWLAGTWPGARGPSRPCRELAPPDAECQGADHAIGVRQRLTLRVGVVGRPPRPWRSLSMLAMTITYGVPGTGTSTTKAPSRWIDRLGSCPMTCFSLEGSSSIPQDPGGACGRLRRCWCVVVCLGKVTPSVLARPPRL
jgi:hypothetical protein